MASVERKGKTLHLLKQGSKAATTGRKRKRHEVFDLNATRNVVMAEESKEGQPGGDDETEFADVTHMLKKPKRNRTQLNNDQ